MAPQSRERDTAMQPIYGRKGNVTGWLNRGVVIDRNNRCRAFIHGESVVSYQGKHLGWLTKGYFRDHRGGAVAWLDGAHGGPTQPIRRVPPIPPIPRIPPISPVAPVPPVRPVAKTTWGETWDVFLGE